MCVLPASSRHVRMVCERQGVPRETNAALLEAVNASGKAFLIHTELGQGDAKQFMIRMAIGATNTQVQHALVVVPESFGISSTSITDVHIHMFKPDVSLLAAPLLVPLCAHVMIFPCILLGLPGTPSADRFKRCAATIVKLAGAPRCASASLCC